MKSLPLVLAFTLLTPQDDSARQVREHVEKLQSEKIEQREGAAQRLYDIGPSALPELRRAHARALGETKGRIGDVIRRLELRILRENHLPPLKRVTITATNRPIREVLEEISRRTGVKVDLSQCSVDGTISLAIRDATPFQALDEVCREVRLLSYSLPRRVLTGYPRNPEDLFICFMNKPFRQIPTAYVRHYRFRVLQIALLKRTDFQRNEAAGWIEYDFAWIPNARPGWFQSLRILKLTDDRGREIPFVDNPAPPGGFSKGILRFQIRGRAWEPTSGTVGFRYPGPEVKKIASIEGMASLRFPLETKTVTFQNPASSVGKRIRVGGYEIHLKGFEVNGVDRSVTVEVTGPVSESRRKPEDPHRTLLDFVAREDVRVVSVTGKKLRFGGGSARGTAPGNLLPLRFSGPREDKVKEIRIRCVLSHFTDEVSFEVKNIPLPE